MRNSHKTKLATEVRFSFVESLYSKRNTLLVGMLSHLIVALMAYHSTSQSAFIYFSVGIVLIWTVRMIDMMYFDQVDKNTIDLSDIRYWEMRYVVGAVSISLLLGLMTAYAIIFSGSLFAQISTITVTFATLVAVVGRNFGSKINVDMMVLAVCLPVLVGFAFSDDAHVRWFALLLLPIFLATRSMANGVRNFLYASVMSEKKSSVLAERFDGAINNMSHGLIMLDPGNKISVINHKARMMLGIPNTTKLVNRNFDAVLRYSLRNASFSRLKAREIMGQLSGLVIEKQQRIQIEIDADYYLEFSARHQSNGGVVIIFEDVTGKVKSDQKILHMARYDSLTNIPNREWFQQLVQQKILVAGPDDKVGIAIVDIIDFKHINDTKGHTVGDFLLRAVADRLAGFAPDDVIVSRLGGDEFVAFFHKGDVSEIEEQLDALFKKLSAVYKIEGDEFRIHFSAGLAVEDRAEMQLESLHINADIALQEARKRGNDHWSTYISSMDNNYSERQKLKFDLRKAIESNELTVAYQPMFTPDGRVIAGAEALSRWEHCELGPISPGIYIPLAEELGLVRKLTESVIKNATKDCASWPEELFVSVNLSARDLVDSHIIEVISEALSISGLAPTRLHLEVTESAVIDEAEIAANLLREMRQMGMSIAIDDFGTGYSSLSYLDQLPLNKVKIDRSFVKGIVRDERKVKLLRGIVNMSRELGLDIVTEGVETNEQLQLVCQNDCADLIQGFIFGMPMPSTALAELALKLDRRNLSGDETLHAV